MLIREHDLLDHPFAITLFDNHIYWTDWRTNAVIRANKWNASDLSVIQRTSMQLFDVKIMHPSRQPRSLVNPCGIDNGNCSHLCLLSINGTYKCACPHIMILTSDNRTCRGTKPRFLPQFKTGGGKPNLSWKNSTIINFTRRKGTVNFHR